MEEILAKFAALWAQAKPYLIASIPTVILLVILHVYLQKFFFQPLARALDERKKATEGANKVAHKSFEAARQKTQEYEEKLRNARTEIFLEYEQLRANLRAEQEAALREVKAKADAMLADARKQIQSDSDIARRELEAEADAIAEKIATTVLNGRNN